MPKEDFINEYMDVREVTFRSSTIVSAFKKSGMWPINRAIFTNDDFAPSIPYSTEAQDFPSLPELPEVDDLSDSASESDSDDSDVESIPLHRNHSPQPRSTPPTAEQSTQRPMSPTSEQQSSMPQASSTNSTPFPVGPIPPIRFYHDPVLFDRIQQLEHEVQRLSGHVKMVELELQNEK
jgi:hypothetical protein